MHDIQFAVQQLVEMAVRALSPGTNDPYTAHNAFNELATGMLPLARRPVPHLGRSDSDGNLRLIVSRLPVTELLDDIFDAVRIYALDAPVAMTAAIMLARRIGVNAVDPDVRGVVLGHLESLDRALASSTADSAGIARSRADIEVARRAVESATAVPT